MTLGMDGTTGADLSVADRERQVLSLRQSLGDRHPSTLAALRGLMEAQRAAGDFVRALATGEELLAENRLTWGPSHRDTLSLALAVANWRLQAGDPATAAGELDQLIPLLENELGTDHADTLLARHTLAGCRLQDADPVAMLTTWLRLFADEQRVFGAEHPTTLAARHNFALWRRRLGDTVGAMDEISRVLAIRRRLLGEEHPDTLSGRLTLETWRGESGDTSGAVAEVIGLIPTLGRAFGEDSEQMLAARHLCASWGQDTEHRPLEAVAEWAVLAEDQARVLGADHPLTVAGREMLAARRAEWNSRLDDEQELAADIYQDMEIEESGSDALTMEIAAKAAAYGAEQRAKAVELLDSVIAVKKEIARYSRDFGADSEAVLRARYDLAFAFWKGQEYAQATDHTQRLIEDCVRVLGEGHELTGSARHLLSAGQSYQHRAFDATDAAFPNMTVAQMAEIRRYALEALADNGIEATFNADGTVLQRADGFCYGLDNLVASCHNLPADQWRATVTTHLVQLTSAAEQLPAAGEMTWSEVATRVRSRVVPSVQVDESQGMLSYAWPLAEGLHEVLCLDFPDVVSFMNSSQVAAYDNELLREIARRNTIAEPIEKVEQPDSSEADVYALFGASSFIASKIVDIAALAPDYIPDASRGVIVGVPARGVLILHPLQTHGKLFAALNQMSHICPYFHQTFPGSVSENMYFWKGGRLQRISRVDTATGQVRVEITGDLAAALEGLDQ